MKIDVSKMDNQAAHHLFIGAIVPRPIAWVSTISEQGVFNLAPFSYFMPVCNRPPVVGFSASWKRDGSKKDTLRNIEFSKEFVINIATQSIALEMNRSAFAFLPDVSEFKETGLTPVKADFVKVPLVGESPVSMECRLKQIIEFGEPPVKTSFIMGDVLLVHVKDEFYTSGSIDDHKLEAIGRMGEEFYCSTKDVFEIKRLD